MKKSLKVMLLFMALLMPWATKVNAQCDTTECSITIVGSDSDGDGWNGALLSIYQDTTLRGTFTVSGASATQTIPVCAAPIRLEWTTGSYDSECSFTVTDMTGMQLYNSNGNTLSGTIFNGRACPTCLNPSLLQFASLTSSSVELSWAAGATEASWNVVVSDSLLSDPSTSSDIQTSSDTQLSWNGLTPATAYFAWVQADCGGGDVSDWVGPIAFTTLCDGPVSIPYTTGFEGIATGDNPACWSSLQTITTSVSTFPSVYEHAPNARTGNVYYEFECASAGGTEIAALPEVDNLNTLQLTFWGKLASSSYAPSSFEVGVIEEDESGNQVFAPVETITFGTSYAEYVIYFNNYSGNGNRMAFRCSKASGQYTVFLDDLSITEAPSCLPVSGLAVSNPTTSSLDITWVPTGDESAWNIAYSTTPMTADDLETANTETASTIPYTVSGLDASTNYFFYVQANCGSNENGEWVGPVAGRTTIDCEGLTYMNAQVGDGNTNITNAPVYNNWGSSYTQEIFTEEELSAMGIYEGDLHSISIQWNDANAKAKNMAIYLANTTKSEFANNSDWMSDSLFTTVWVDSNYTFPAGWNRYDFNAPFHYDGGNLAIAWLSNHNGSSTTSVTAYAKGHTASADRTIYTYADNTILDPATVPAGSTSRGITTNRANVRFEACVDMPDCPMPNSLALTGVGTDYATLSWVEMGTATAWDVYYDTVLMDDNMNGELINVYDNPATITDLTPMQQYYFYVRSSCGGDVTSWIGPISAIPSTYNMRANQTDTIHACDILIFDDGGANGNAATYQNSTLIVYSNDETMGVTLSGSYNVYGYYDRLIIYDGVGINGDVLFNSNGTNTGNVNVTPVTGVATIIYNTDYSSAEGFQLQLTCQEMSDCMTPSQFVSTGATSDEVTLSWHENGEASAWDIYYDTTLMTDDMNGTIEPVYDNPATISGLSAGSRYYFYVRANCGGEESMWAGPVSVVPGTWITRPNMTDTLTLCGGVIYDDGGLENGYSNDQSSTIILIPTDSETMGVGLTGTVNVESGYDDFYIYDGIGTSGTLLAHISGSSNVNVASLSGPLTIFFTCDEIVNANGYELFVTCFDRSCPAVTNLTVAAVDSASVTLTWDIDGDNATSFDIQYHTAPFSYGDSVGTHVNALASPFTVTGLASNTQYYFAVATECSGQYSMVANAQAHTTCAGLTPVPYVENFDTYNDGDNPDCWTVLQAGSSYSGNFPSVYEYSYNALNGDNYYEFETNGTETEVVTLPAFANLQDLQMKFFARTFSSAEPTTFEVGVLDDTAFVSLENITLNTNNYEEYTVYFASYTGTSNHPAIRVTGSNYTVFVDSLVVSNAPDCLPVTGLAVTGTTSTEVTLDWNANGTTAWEVAYADAPITDFTGVTPVSATTHPVTISGLTSGTTYYFYVRSDCGAGALGEWIGPVTGTPGTWNMRANQTDTLTTCGIRIFDDGGLENFYGNGQESYLILMPSAPSSAISVMGSYDIEGSSWDVLKIYEGVGTSGAILADISGSSHMIGNLSAVSGTGPLTIYFKSDGSVNYAGFDLTVSCVSNTCPRVTNIHAIAAGTDYVDVEWESESGSEWQIEYGAAGFEQGSGSTGTSSTNMYTLTGLDSLSAYDVYVRPICGAGDTGAWQMAQVNTSFCDGSVSVLIGSESANSTINACPTNAYYRYTLSEMIVDSIELANSVGMNEVGTLTYKVASSSSQTRTLQIWFQETSKSTFTSGDDIELLDSANAVLVYDDVYTFAQGLNYITLQTPWTWSGNGNLMIIVDDNTGSYSSSYSFVGESCGDYKTLAWFDDTDNPSPTSSTFDGYNANNYNSRPYCRLTACNVSGCHKPVITNVENNYEQAIVTWTGDGDNYEVSIRPESAGTWSAETAVAAHTYTFTGLTPSTNYFFRVRQNCGEDGVSGWTEGSFTTDSLPCFAPTNLHAVNVTNVTATFGWTVGTTETAWILHTYNSTFDKMDTVTTNPATVSGLTAGVTYNVAVAALCGSSMNVLSDWSDAITITTTICDVVTNVAANNVTTNSAVISWTPGANNTGSFEVEYGEVGFPQGAGTTVNANSTSVTLSNLESEETYDVYVRAICGTNYVSEWSEKIQFTTLKAQQGIDGVDANLNVAIYPNPTSGATTITLSGVNGSVNIAIIDMNGRMVMNDVMDCNGNCVKKMEVEGLANGAYFVRIYNDNFNTVKKLIVR